MKPSELINLQKPTGSPPPTNNPEPAKITKLIDKDFEQALEHINTASNFVLTFAGKPAHNPYVWLANNVEPLMARYNDGERSSELLKSMLSIPLKAVPTIDVTKKQLPPL